MSLRSSMQFIGGVFLIVGTTIGAGMLALPVANAEVGFPIASIFLFFCWLIMAYSAFLLLEVNMALPPGSNLVSMAHATLGSKGAYVAWFSYLLLLYSLLCAYISGGSEILENAWMLIGWQVPDSLSILLFVGLLGFVVYLGIKSVDYVNTGLMFGKLSIYIILVALVFPYVDYSKLHAWDVRFSLGPIMVLITSYGFAIILPSLRSYFNDDLMRLRRVVLVGSLIPLFCYIAWDAVIMGVIPRFGPGSLDSMLHADMATTGLTNALSTELNNNWVTSFFRVFSSISMLTAFLGVSLSLSDFLADGFKLRKTGSQGIIVYALTFVPPVIIILFNHNIFIAALRYAGIFCVILLILFPIFMAYSARYKVALATQYRVPGGKKTLIFTALIAFCLLGIGIYEQLERLGGLPNL